MRVFFIGRNPQASALGIEQTQIAPSAARYAGFATASKVIVR